MIRLNPFSIIDKGHNNNGDYIKFEDGTLICLKTISGTNIPTPSFWNGIYYIDINNGNWAFDFIETPNVNATNGTEGLWLGSVRSYTRNSAGSSRLFRTSSASDIPYNINIIGIGKWK